MTDRKATPENTTENEVEAHGESVRPLQELGSDDGNVAPIEGVNLSATSITLC